MEKYSVFNIELVYHFHKVEKCSPGKYPSKAITVPYVKCSTFFQSNATKPIKSNQDWSRIGNNANPTPMQLKCPELEFMPIEPMEGKCCNYSSMP